MILALNGLTTMYCNIKTDIRIAKEAGFDALEIVVSKLLRYLDCGFKSEDLASVLNTHSICPVSFCTIKDIERVDTKGRGELLAEAERLCAVAKVLKCPTIELVSLCGRRGKSWKEVLRFTAKNMADIADIGKRYGIKFQFEPIAWSPIHSLSQALQVIKEAGRENLGLVIDFWHLWAGEETTPDEVAKLSASQIYGVHFCDGIRHSQGEKWIEENLRGFLPGEGKIPIKDWVDAVRATGFDGVWSFELLSPKHWERDPLEIACESKMRMKRYLK